MTYDVRQLANVISGMAARMSARERLLVGGATLVMAGIALWSFVLDPLTSGRAQLGTRISAKERELRTLVQLRRVYLDVEQKLKAGENLLAKADPNFSLFAFLEQGISQDIPRERINSMNPSNKSIGEQYEEQLVEIKLTQVSLEQLVSMLHRIEKSEHPLRVTRLQVKKRSNDIRNFDVVATVSLVKATG